MSPFGTIRCVGGGADIDVVVLVVRPSHALKSPLPLRPHQR